MKKAKIHILGSSVASRFGIDQASWPELIVEKLKDSVEVSTQVQYGLTYTRTIPLLSEIPQVDLLIIHFGIALGWPVSFRRVDIKLGTTPLKNEYAYHQPIGKGRTARSRVKNKVKFRLRNLVKYLLFITGQYKPRVNPRDLEDQITAVLSVARAKAKHILWIQHVPAWSMRTLVERMYYKRHLERVRWFALKSGSSDVTFLVPDGSLVEAENYALDTTHLSVNGHQAYSAFISNLDVIKELVGSRSKKDS